ncbi:MAG TPA: PASTA domain-containing protein, partial [Streptosporangiaceae bacterium]|nr:PASTA domain-containing protein [Streptosporangiaceae bacterium]
SAGPRMITVPQVTGQSLATAQAALRRVGLIPGSVIRQATSALPPGVVWSTRPDAGTPWAQTQPVDIVVSAGPPMPNFVGQQVAVAQQWAQQNGVRLVPLTAARSDQPAGTVIRQSVPAGSAFTSGQVLQVEVSNGPPQVAIPNVDGMLVGNAIFVLHKAGFQVSVQRLGPFTRIVNYSPQGQAPQGSTITITTGPCFGGCGGSP